MAGLNGGQAMPSGFEELDDHTDILVPHQRKQELCAPRSLCLGMKEDRELCVGRTELDEEACGKRLFTSLLVLFEPPRYLKLI